MERLVVLLSPIIPQVTSVIAKELKINFDKFPKINYVQLEKRIRDNDELLLVNEIMKFNRFVWKEKKEKGISLRDEIEEIKIPPNLKPFEKDLKTAHNLI